MVDTSRLSSWLSTSGLQRKDPPLFQVISNLIKALNELQLALASINGSGGGSSTTIIEQITIGIPGMDGDDGEISYIPVPASSGGSGGGLSEGQVELHAVLGI